VSAHSRTKGAAAEREVVALCQSLGFPSARRYAPIQAAVGGAEEAADVMGAGRLWLEVKRRGKGSMYALAVDAVRERPGHIPVMAYREDRGPWLAVLPLQELLKLERDALRSPP
jgi:Holliday junction resolvase